MSDGNYNRALLPHTDYQSGVRAGRAAERGLAIDTLRDVLAEQLPELSVDDLERVVSEFRLKLAEREP